MGRLPWRRYCVTVLFFGDLKTATMKSKRICVYTSDIEALTGKSPRVSRDLMSQVGTQYQKEKHQLVSYCELAAFLNLKPEVVFQVINNLPVVQEEE